MKASFRRVARGLLVAGAISACSDDPPVGPDPTDIPDLLLVTSIADQTGSNGSAFVQTVSLTQGTASNTNAFEQVFFPYASVYQDDVVVTQHFYGDQAVRYRRGSDGRLSEAGRMSLPAGGFGASVVFASPTRAYVALVYTGKIIAFNPQTMTQTGEIDLTTLGIARNPANPQDRNPEPAVLALRAGKLYVALQQLTSGFASADGADVAVFDEATGTFERVIRDTRATGPGRFGYNQTMFVDEAGDLYVYCIASFGFVPGQTAGILRIRAGQSEFDPNYFVNLSAATIAVPGGRVGLLNGIGYGGNGDIFAMAEIPSLLSNPPNYATDRAFQAIRIRLATGQVEVLPLPRNNGNSTGITFQGNRVLFGMSTTTGVGIYTYDRTSGQGSASPVLTTVGDPTLVLAFSR